VVCGIGIQDVEWIADETVQMCLSYDPDVLELRAYHFALFATEAFPTSFTDAQILCPVLVASPFSLVRNGLFTHDSQKGLHLHVSPTHEDELASRFLLMRKIPENVE
jgi:hypothetical protein